MRKFIDIVTESAATTFWHGSLAPIDGAYRPLTHFGTRNAALTRALYQAHKVGKKEVWLHEVVLDISHPLKIADIDQHSVIKMIDYLHYDLRRFSAQSRNAVFAAMPNGTEEQAFASVTRAEGYDGFSYVNRHEDRGSTSMIIIETQQAVPVSSPLSMTFDEGLAIIQGLAG